MSSDLEWLLLRKNNSFIVKRVAEGPIFSKEPGNLLNLHSHKYSGLANAKTIDVRQGPNGVEVTHRKKSASPLAVASARKTTVIRNRTGSRAAFGVAANTAKRGYRPDLRRATVARVSALLVAQNEPKPAPAPKVRGKKAKTFFNA
ncbi:ribosomal protein L28e [Auriscalpium vulgare]|uniref:Ribosomal protein L28e n=1 Tax=Auriscalpium vulgare TaxID=40419 RepID=A0ACB8R2Z6_9AGAM|nr:ribosomal protein L28e [Auriscalpium vulgare]